MYINQLFLTNWIRRCKDLIQGHCEAQLVLAQLANFNERERIRAILLAHNITGAQIAYLYNEECKRDIYVFISYLTEGLLNV